MFHEHSITAAKEKLVLKRQGSRNKSKPWSQSWWP